MKRHTYSTRLTVMHVFCWLAAMHMMMTGCSSADRSEHSAYYTRGIGSYPGDPSENFSPEIVPAPNEYRNLALLRTATASSSYDYNLTAQLVTDGIVSDGMPRYLTLESPEGEIPRREREWLFDRGPFSRNFTTGENAFFHVTLNNWQETATKVYFFGAVAYRAENSDGRYRFLCEGSNDGVNWQQLGVIERKGLPGTPSAGKAYSDPNKNSGGEPTLPIRNLEETVTFRHPGAYSHYRVHFMMKGAAYWKIQALDFYNGNEILNFLPSKFFNSSWMSSSAGKEWVMIDLGKASAFDKVVLKWKNKAVKGELQVSDDARKWNGLCSLPGGTDLQDEIKAKGKGRYVRVMMTQAANAQPYVLGEMEVWGKGGVTPCPANTPTQTIDRIRLSGGNWQLQRASEVQAGGEEISKPGFNSDNWPVATVPGTVLTSYRNIGAVPDPNHADNLMQISESFFNSNFWYRDEFEIPSDFSKERTFLNFDGINWKADIFVNGVKAGRMEGAFIRGKFDVTHLVHEGKNAIAVEIIRNAHIGAVKEKYEKNTDFNGGILGADNPTFHASIGWDWISTIRGRNTGIWNDVYLTTKGNVTLHDPYVRSVLPLPDTTSAALTPEVIVSNHDRNPVSGVLSGKIGDIEFQKNVELNGEEEKTVRFSPDEFKQLNMRHPHLWWPKGYGAPHLYDASFTFRTDNRVSDDIRFKVGIRQMTYNEENDVLRIYVNGRRFIARGGNWGFGESNLNYRGREYETAVKYHTDMNFTMMRNWVGQIGDEELYEACDRAGLMIWQDFWLANPCDGPDPDNEAMFMANADDYVKRIRNHPSIGIYCGRNEGFPPQNIDNGIRLLLKERHPDIHYISSSADRVVSGHGPYRALAPKEYFALKAGSDKLHSERGMPNVMNYESLERTLSPDALWPQNAQWGQHDYTMEGAQSCASFNAIIEKGFGKPHNAKQFADLAQWVNYDGYRAMFESRGKNRKGLLLWMSHPCWPSMVWQTYDYYFEPTAAYFGCKKACEPLHIQWNQATDTVEVVNYSAGTHNNLKAEARIVNLDGSVAWQKSAVCNSSEDTTQECLALDFSGKLSETHFVILTLTENGKVVSDNFYLRGQEEGNFRALKDLPRVKPVTSESISRNIDKDWQATVTLENNTQTPALMVRLNLIGADDKNQILPVLYSDNYFPLLPGEKKEVVITWKDVDTRGNKPEIVISGYNVDCRTVD